MGSDSVNAREEWLQERLRAEMWWCEDEVCDCTQPKIDRVRPNLKAGYPFVLHEEVWRGTFHSQASMEEREEQRQELREACARFGVEVPESARLDS